MRLEGRRGGEFGSPVTVMESLQPSRSHAEEEGHPSSESVSVEGCYFSCSVRHDGPADALR